MELAAHQSRPDNVYDFTQSLDLVPLSFSKPTEEEEWRTVAYANEDTVVELSHEGFSYCLESTSPLHVHGNLYCHMPNRGPAVLFWREGSRFFAKKLTSRQSSKFRDLCGLKRTVE